MKNRQEIIANSKSLSLEEYRQIIDAVVQEKSTEIYEQKTQSYILKCNELCGFIKSNLSLSKKFFNAIQKTETKKICLITEAWCLDASIIPPILEAIEIANDKIEICIYLRDQNEELMNQYLTNGSKSIPIVFGLDENNNEIFHWGPRSQKAKDIITPLLKEEYKIKSQALSEFYMSDLTLDIQEEWIKQFN